MVTRESWDWRLLVGGAASYATMAEVGLVGMCFYLQEPIQNREPGKST